MKKQDLLYLARQRLVGAGLGRGAILVVAVSGGPDSMALLDVLRQTVPGAGGRLVVAHIDHQLRRGSAQDAKLVEKYCERYRLDCVIQTITLPARVKQAKTRIEETAREWRYRALRKIAKQSGAHKIITAHNADDQIETVIFNFLRGSGIRGMGGMREVANDIIRPFLSVSKADLLRYVKRHRVPFVIDETNRQLQFTRNRIRHQLLPELRQYNPRLDAVLLQNSQLFQQADFVLRDLAHQLLQLIGSEKSGRVSISISQLMELVPYMRMEVVRMAVERVSGGVYNWTGAHFAEVSKLIISRAKRGSARLPGKLVVARAYDTITISQG